MKEIKFRAMYTETMSEVWLQATKVHEVNKELKKRKRQ